ncbi:MAG TPA: putative sulfate exporter family transporter [Bacteroidia bacterium]
MFSKINLTRGLFVLVLILCFTPLASAPAALFAGLIFSLVLGNPFHQYTKKGTGFLLKACVVGLGFGIHADQAMEAGSKGVLFTIATIFGTIILGYLIGKWFKIESKTSHLISCGTAICGGSAIAAIAPVIRAKEDQISMALGTVFTLNAISLFIFPFIGAAFHLSQTQFGIWAAVAIHDTSSVVGASSKYGLEAMQIATTVKLARALWIIPVVFFSAMVFKNRTSKLAVPYFMILFFIAMLLNSYIPALAPVSAVITFIAGKGIIVTLFLIGSDLSKETIRSVGFKPFFQGILLWVVISVASLAVIIQTVK